MAKIIRALDNFKLLVVFIFILQRESAGTPWDQIPPSPAPRPQQAKLERVGK